MENYDRDLRGKFVLISRNYWYFGKDAVSIPNNLLELTKVRRNYIKIQDQNFINNFDNWLMSFQENGYIAVPFLFQKGFERYSGK